MNQSGGQTNAANTDHNVIDRAFAKLSKPMFCVERELVWQLGNDFNIVKFQALVMSLKFTVLLDFDLDLEFAILL